MHNRLLNIVTEYKKEAYTDVILQKPDAQLIYHLSPQRHTIVDFFEWTGTEQVLELAALNCQNDHRPDKMLRYSV